MTTREALKGLLDHYVRLIESGDAGSWNAEKEPVVIAARAALAEPEFCEWRKTEQKVLHTGCCALLTLDFKEHFGNRFCLYCGKPIKEVKPC